MSHEPRRLECTGCNETSSRYVSRWICNLFIECSDGDEQNRISDYCERCGHLRECHEPIEEESDE